MNKMTLAAFLGWIACCGQVVADGLEVTEAGKSPARRITVNVPGAYKAVISQESGGGISEFYDLVADPEAKRNLTSRARGLLEIGWHGAEFKSPADQPNCCVKHMLQKDREGLCYDGCRDWPSLWHKDLSAEGELEVIEKSPVRIRIQARSCFTWWGQYVDKDLLVTATYTFYSVGRIVTQVRVHNKGQRTFRWSTEYGPHLFVPGWDEKPEIDPGFAFRAPNLESARPTIRPSGKKTKLLLYPPQPVDVVAAVSDKVPTSFLITVPKTLDKLFDRPFHHNGRDIGWDRCGYGSNKVIMEPGHDSTWACLIQMGSTGGKTVPQIKKLEDALAHALPYRQPARVDVSKGELVKNDPGDLDADGFNESEGCWVLRSKSAVELTF
ncbi:MAG TPA: hypothetical protein VKE98_09670, partial [Gemmataceae bacterium]|nr:hypothetical protein [Gemmataceae bacterium]